MFPSRRFLMPTPREASIWGKIRTDLNEAQQNILNGRYAEAMVLDREILKRIVRMQVDKAVLVSNNLESDIEQLFENRLISKETRDQYHAIRLYAEQTENGVQATAQAANDSFSLLKDALEHYVDSNAQRSSGGSYETRSFQGSSRFSSGYSGPAAGERSFAAAGSDSYASTDAADSVGSRYEADGSDDADTVRRYTATENEGGYDTDTGSEDFGAGTAATPRSSFDASGVDLPLGNAPRRSGSNVHHRSSRNTNQRPTRPLRDSERVSRNGNRRPAAASTAKQAAASGRRNANRPRGGQKGRKQELDLYGILKYVIPILCLILAVILIRVLMGNSGSSTIETTPAATVAVTESVMETDPIVPETTAAPEPTTAIYMTTTGVKVRTEPNTDCRVLAVLDAGTQVTYKGEADGWVNIDYNGENAYIKSDFVQPVAAETPAAETPAA